ncbi:MAG: amino acid adenylation domain-containing protein, partial [Candidatus Eremiobacteraeota bacterium]|nr:amino acid adenylation domain-containing protein [Candidatus Eremiobacteraeota bacterium]
MERPTSDETADLIVFPTTSTQRRLWFMEQYGIGAGYTIAAAFRIRGPFDPSALERALQDLIARHEALRTAIRMYRGEPAQVVEERCDFRLARASLEDLSAAQRETELLTCFAADARERFDLRSPPLLRASLLRLGAADHALLIAIHHAVADGTSIAVLVEELAHLYRRQTGEPLAPLPDHVLQFGDVAAWLDENREAADDDLAFWRDRLAGAQALALPLDRPPPLAPTQAGAERRTVLDPAQVCALESYARAHGTTPFVAWAALYAIVLSQLCSQTDLCIGTPVANRQAADLERVVGLLANSVVLRVDLKGCDTFGELLAHMRDAVVGALAHQAAPFDVLVNELGIERSAWRSPLVQTFFTFDERPATASIPGLSVEPLPLSTGSARVELSLELLRDGDRLDATLQYSTELFEPRTAQRILDAFARVLHEISTFPEAPLALGARLAARAVTPSDGPVPTRSGRPDIAAALAAIWMELLGAAPDDATDFFLAGGHSLLATRLVGAVRERLEVQLPLRDVFVTPTFGALATHLRELAAQPTAIEPDEPIPSVARGGPLPLSSAQQRLWFLQQLDPAAAAYSIFGAYAIDVPLDHEVLRRAIAETQRRHESLRTRIAHDGGIPMQIVMPAEGIALPIVDLEHLPEPLREAELVRLGQQEARTPFDLSEAPLARLCLVRLAPDRHVIFVTLHHIIADGWSVDIMAREILATYRALEDRRPLDLPAVEVQYADYATWQSDRLEHRRAALLEYWKAQLSGVTPLELPADRPRPPELSFEGRRLDFSLDRDLLRSITDLARGENAGVFAVLLAAFALLLARYSGQSDFAIGVPVPNRPRRSLEGVIGCFVNVLPIRFDLAAPMGFRALVRIVHAALLDGQAHAELPFEELVDALQLPRDVTRNPVFQVLASHRADIGADIGADAVQAHRGARPIPIDPGFAQFDLALYVDERRDRVDAAFVFRSALYDADTIERMEQHLRLLLDGALADPDREIAQLPLLTPEEAEWIEFWNDTEVDFDRPATIREHLIAQAARTPHAPAVTFGDRTLTYAELEARAGRLAAALQARGAAVSAPVGVCLERSLELVVALVAAAYAGSPFVVLDPDLPAARIDVMLADARPAVTILNGSTRSRAGGATPLLDLDDPLPDASVSAVFADGESPAYILFTSGSTGRPKGVVVANAGLVNRLLWMQSFYEIGPGDRVLQKTPASFDVSVWEFFWPLTTGAELVVAPPGAHRDPHSIAALIAAHRISVCHFVPSMLDAFLPAADPVRCASLRRVFVSGEALGAETERRFFARGLSATLHNLYGPTEATIDVTAWDALPPGGRRTPPIGFAVPNTRMYVLDPLGAQVPVGIPGELVIGGLQVALGYVGQPELTAQRFGVDPFAGSGRIYRTGDRARYRADGSLEFLGRLDGQVKLRGYRIELGEIEATLARQPGIAAAACAVRGRDASDAVLAAYVVPEGTIAPDITELRHALARGLPEWMIPATITVLPQLPVSSSGKLDRGALPAPAPRPALPAVAPSGEVEGLVTEAWCAVLGLGAVDVTTTFFELGGTSLGLIRVHAALSATFPSLTVLDLFRFPTVRALAEHVARAPAARAPVANRASAHADESGIAIVGMAGRFPGADGIDALWSAILSGREVIDRPDRAELLARGVDPGLLDDPRFVAAVAAPRDIDRFDAAFFGFTPADATALDPQQRLFLTCAWEALEHAAQDPERCRGPVAVFGGTSLSAYALRLLNADGGLRDPAAAYEALLAADKDYLASRVAYKLGLTGPAITVQTACSTSAVAIHFACESLRRGEAALALAGGASLSLPDAGGYLAQAGGVTSADGHCRPFDRSAGGTVPAGGIGVVVLKRLADAVADRDTIHAVILASAVNNDGAARVGFTAPGVDGQSAVIEAAHAAAGIDPSSIGYVETHGTGTPLGDLVEIGALTRAFRRGEPSAWPPVGSCAIGSIKAIVGHMDAASGVGGVIKAALAVEHGVLPPSPYFEQADDRLCLDESPFYVNTEVRGWGGPRVVRRAGVSSFGIGGTNVHLVLEQAPPVPAGPAPRAEQILTLSARTPEALDAMRARLANDLERVGPNAEALADVAYTLQVGRRAFDLRRAFTVDGADDAIRRLRAEVPKNGRRDIAGAAGPPAIALLFPGQGAQYPAMAADLEAACPQFAQAVERCLAALDGDTASVLRALAFSHCDRSDADAQLQRTEFAQPAIFIASYALAVQLLAWGVRPQAVAGHSVGEFVAATVAGIFEPEDAVRLVALRGNLMQRCAPGAMLAVELSAPELATLLPSSASIAAANSPSLSVAAGTCEAIDDLRRALETRGVAARLLNTSHAFHSALVEPIVPEFAAAVARVPMRPPRCAIASGLTGTWLRAGEMTSADYWSEQIRKPVAFGDVVDTLAAEPARVFVEVGPGRALSGLARSHPAVTNRLRSIATLGSRDGGSAQRRVLDAVGELWCAGVSIDWDALHAPAEPRRVALPGYPLAPQRFWAVPAMPSAAPEPAGELWRERWLRDDRSLAEPDVRGGRWLLCGSDGPVAQALADAIRTAGGDVSRADDEAPWPDGAERIVFVAPPDGADGEDGWCDLLALGRRLTAAPPGTAPRLGLVTTGAVAVLGDELPSRWGSMARALALVADQEGPGLGSVAIDLPAGLE